MSQLSGLVMHVANNLSDVSRRRLEHDVMHHEGVASARFNKTRPYFMVVEYDPQQINSFEIMNEVNNNAVNTACLRQHLAGSEKPDRSPSNIMHET